MTAVPPIKRVRTFLGIVCIFLLGMLAGGTLGLRAAERFFQKILAGGPPELTRFVAGHLKRKLHLDPAQETAIRKITAEALREVESLRARIAPETRVIGTRTEQRIRAELRPDQQRAFDRLLAARKPRPAPPQDAPAR